MADFGQSDIKRFKKCFMKKEKKKGKKRKKEEQRKELKWNNLQKKSLNS